MSRVKNRGILVLMMLTLLTFFAFGCENKSVGVDDIYFTEESLTLVVGESYTPSIVVQPSYADDTSYTITSTNAEYVSVENNEITALKVTGSNTVYLQVTANDNSLKTDMIRVNVIAESVILETPRNLRYDENTQSISFSSSQYATSYVLRVSGKNVETNDTTFSCDVNVGNVTTLSLNDLQSKINELNLNNSSVFDTALTIQASAVTDSNTSAYVNSSFSSALSLYQTSAPTNLTILGGVLSFEGNANNYSIAIDGTEIMTTSRTADIDLTEIDEEFAGISGMLSVTALAEQTGDIPSYNSVATTKEINVLDVANVSIQAGNISWGYVTYANSYDIYLNGAKIANVTTNQISLDELDADITQSEVNHEITVEPVLDSASQNILKTCAVGDSAFVNKLATPNLVNDYGIIRWEGVANAGLYIAEISYILDGETTTVTRTTTENSFIFDESFPSGANYTFKLHATSTQTGGVYYMDSNSDEIELTKVAGAEISIENSSLVISATAGESYSVSLDDTETVILTAESSSLTYDLTEISLTAGEHTLSVVHLGRDNTISSNPSTISFEQLGEVENANILDSVATADLGENYSELVFDVTQNDEITYSYTGTSFTINSTNSALDDYLASGDYVLKIYAKGDGTTTLTSQIASEIEFSVLASPIVDSANIDKNSPTITFTEIENALGYVVIMGESQEELLTNTYTFEVSSSSPIEFSLQAIGNGTNVLSSAKSQVYTLVKLTSPTLEYDADEEIFVKTDSNDAESVQDYVFERFVDGNWEELDYDFSSKYTDLTTGENEFRLTLIARDFDSSTNTIYLNADVANLSVRQLASNTSITTTLDNMLVVITYEVEEYGLQLEITNSADEVITFTGENGQLVSDTGNITLTYEFRQVGVQEDPRGDYFIEILNADYTCKIPSLTGAFSVRARLLSNGASSAHGEFGFGTTISFETTTTFTPSAFTSEYLAFDNHARNIENYAILVNGSETLMLNSDVASVDADLGVIKVLTSYIYDNSSAMDSGVELAVVSLCDLSGVARTLSQAGESITISRIDAPELIQEKDNASSNHSVVLSFDLVNNSNVIPTYLLEIFNRNEDTITNVRSFTFTNSNDTDGDGKITLNLDDYASTELNGTTLDEQFYVRLKVLVEKSSSADENSYIFNSAYSNELEFTRLSSVTNIIVQNGVLVFDAVENAVGYDVYRYEGTDLVRINNSLILENQYTLADITGNVKIVVRAIAGENSGYTNSNISSITNVNRLSINSISTFEGKIMISLDESTVSIINNTEFSGDISTLNGIILTVETADNLYYLQVDDDKVSAGGNLVLIDPTSIIGYGVDSLKLENLTFTLLANYTSESGINYLNSRPSEFNVYGLIAPVSLTKVADMDNYTIEYISWSESGLNTLQVDGENVDLVLGYILKVRTGERTLYSFDTKLKYLDGDSLKSYGDIINTTMISAPYGYDDNDDGEITEEERFDDGEFFFSVMAMPKSISSADGTQINLLMSQYSAELRVNILAVRDLRVVSGEITWEADNDATAYLVTVYDGEILDENLLTTYQTITTSFDFSEIDLPGSSYEGVYGVKVRAISTKPNVLNSQDSKELYVFRLSNEMSVTVDDGNLILEANTYYTNAEIEFVDNITGRKEVVYFSNEDISNSNIEGLNTDPEITWLDYISRESELMTATKRVVNIDNSNIINITQGRSYTINIRLLGNTNIQLGLINSKVANNVDTINVIKLSQTVFDGQIYQVEKGVYTYDYIEDYLEVDLNYNFNNSTSVSPFFSHARIYKLTLSTANVEHAIYAIDYYSFIDYQTELEADEYQIFETGNNTGAPYAYVLFNYSRTDGSSGALYFNVYKDNQINLRDSDYIYYYPITVEETDGELVYSSTGTRTSINVAEGGSFTLGLSLLGGDSITDTDEHMAYLNASSLISDTFIRYRDNSLSAYDGYVRFNDLKPMNEQGGIIDYPIYKLVATPLNETLGKTIYIYYTTEEDARSVIDDPDAIYVAAEFSAEVGLQDAILFDMSPYFTAGTYLVSIQTLAGLGDNGYRIDYLLNARIPTGTTAFKKPTDTSVSINGGALYFSLATVTDNNATSYIYNYEITLSDGFNEYVYEIDSSSEGVTIDSSLHTLSYELPESIEIEDETIYIFNNTNYSIKVRALAGTVQDRINGSYTQNECSFTRSAGIGEVWIENGVLMYQVLDTENYQVARIRVSYLDDTGNERIVLIRTNGNKVDGSQDTYSYEFSYAIGSTYPIQGGLGSTTLDAGRDYSISVQVLSSNNSNSIINSNYSSPITVNRLVRIDSSEIESFDGILTWPSVVGATTYIVELTSGTTTYTFNTESNSIDFDTGTDTTGRTLPSGEYTITIRSLGSDMLNSRTSNRTGTFTKLVAVENIHIDQTDTGLIVWDAVEGADKYEVVFTYGEQIESVTTYNTYTSAPDSMSGRFTVQVKALSEGSGNTFNGNYGTYTSSTDQPQPVGEIQFNNDEYYYYFEVSDFLSGDRVLISYDFTAYEKTADGYQLADSADSIEVYINYGDRNSQITIGETTYYMFKPTAMGIYRNMQFRVVRTGTLASSTTQVGLLDLNIYAYGDGSSENPYGIGTAEHLLNIEINPNAQYELYSSVDLSEINVNSRVDESGAIICTTFTGTLDGNTYSIYGLTNLSLTGRLTFGLFANLDGATVKDLTIGRTRDTIVVTNSFTANPTSAISLGLLAGTSTNSTITNVSVNNLNFVVNSSVSINTSNIYVGGLIGRSNGDTITGGEIQTEITLNAGIAITTNSFFGGLLGYAQESDVVDTMIEFSLSQTASGTTLGFIGGLAGQIVGNSNSNRSTISGVIVETYLEDVSTSYFGGIVGYASYVNINDSQTTGSFINSGMTSTYGERHLGGIVGRGDNVNIGTEGNVTIGLTFDISAYNTNSLYVGAVAGGLYIVGSGTAGYDNCAIDYSFINGATTFTGNEMNIGIYGICGSGVSHGSCEQTI